MLKDITLGQYLPGKSLIHRLDPRTKILLTIVYIAMIFCVSNPVWYVIPLAFLILCAKMSGLKAAQLLKTVKPLRFLLILTFVLNLFFSSGETVLVNWGILRITREGLIIAVHFCMRLIFLVAGTSVLTLTTSPISLCDGMETLLKPLSKLHFPAHELAMMMKAAISSSGPRPWCPCWCRCSSALSAGRESWPWPWRRAAITAARAAPGSGCCIFRKSTGRPRW